MIEIRRDIHSHPELANQESRTAEIIARNLRSYGLEVRTEIGGHGVVGILKGANKGTVVAYRADMDALPMDIQEDVPYRSQSAGIAHACGHDVHTTLGLGIARVLSSLRDELPGTVVLIFQPAEETIEGAQRMIQEGVLSDPRPEAIFAVHVVPVEVGKVVTNPGVGLPGTEDFAFFINEVPGVMFFLGASNPDTGIMALPHSPFFQVDEGAIPVGIKTMSNVLASYLLAPPGNIAR